MRRRSLASLMLSMAVFSFGCNGADQPNEPPEIRDGLQFEGAAIIAVGQSVQILLGAVNDADNDPLTFVFTAHRGRVDPEGPTKDPITAYTAPSAPGQDTVTVKVSDSQGGIATATRTFTVVTGPPTPAPDPGAVITAPEDGSLQGETVNMSGTITGRVPADTKLWTVVRVGGLFYPQSEALVVGDEWTGTARLGGTSGEVYDLIVAFVDEEAQDVFERWIEEGQRTGDFPGFPALPSGVSVQDSVQITQQ